MGSSTWDSILLDGVVTAPPVDGARFRQWVSGQRIFVSSVMDAEMMPYREALRKYLESFGSGVPLMWETISPADLRPNQAFLDGVDRSTQFLLMLGKGYGVADDTGYSPTHKEGNRAKQRHLYRMLFTLAADRSERDGKLNDWLGALYAEISGNQVSSPDHLITSLDARLRELAARAQRNWIKLGSCVFPGLVEMTSEGHAGRSFRVVARAQDHRVRRALAAMGGRGGDIRLTWPNETFPVLVERVRQLSEYANEAEIEIACRTPQNWYGGAGGGFGGITINNMGPSDLTAQWADYAIFGKDLPRDDRRSGWGLMGIRPEVTALPRVLSATGASGWQAEGLVRLYAVEQTAFERGGHFAHLSVGPATATEVPLEGEVHFEGFGGSSTSALLSGVVPLRR